MISITILLFITLKRIKWNTSNKSDYCSFSSWPIFRIEICQLWAIKSPTTQFNLSNKTTIFNTQINHRWKSRIRLFLITKLFHKYHPLTMLNMYNVLCRQSQISQIAYQQIILRLLKLWKLCKNMEEHLLLFAKISWFVQK